MSQLGRKTKIGVVISDKMHKSRVVKVKRMVKHPAYKKTIIRFTKFLVHDEGNISKTGDGVKIQETKPLSRRKKWRIIEILSQDKEKNKGTE